MTENNWTPIDPRHKLMVEISTAAMQGILSQETVHHPGDIAAFAIKCAEALLIQLEIRLND